MLAINFGFCTRPIMRVIIAARCALSVMNSFTTGNVNEILNNWFKLILVIDGWCEICLGWFSMDLTGENLALVQLSLRQGICNHHDYLSRWRHIRMAPA